MSEQSVQENMSRQHLPFAFIAERLAQLVPSLASRRLALDTLNTQHIEDALRKEGIYLEWSWETVEHLHELLERWPVQDDELLLIAHPASKTLISSTRRELVAAPVPYEHLFTGQDVFVIGRDSRFIGLCDAQYKHTHVQVPRLFPDPLHFYSVTHEYGEFSNFALYPIRLRGKTWPTSEHYFQAQKFSGTPHEALVRQAKTPMEAARMGRQRARPLRQDWESVKFDVMRQALLAKFTQHDALKDLLLASHPSKLVERTQHDKFWGDGGDGRGQNWLGRLLMELREKMHHDASFIPLDVLIE